jgi:lysophospholipase L1-like esterase
MRRSVGSFTRLGFDVRRASVPVFLGHEDNVSMLSAAARESLALAYYRWRGWLGPAVEQRHVNTGFGASTANVQEPAFPDGPLVILGASYARGWDPKHIAGKDVRNVGIDGQQSFEMLARFDRDVIAARPRGVVLWGFINDIFRSQPQDLDAALARVRQSYADMVERARANGVEPVIATEVTLRPAGGLSNSIRLLVAHLRKKQSYQDRINRQVIAINVWLSDLAHREGLLLLDFQGALSDEHGRRRAEFIADDGSHITPAGYAALTDYAKPVLERHFTRAD